MILTHCPQCHCQFQAPESLANRRVKCPQCQTPFTVASPAAAPTQPSVFAAVGVGESTTRKVPPLIAAPRGWRYLSSPWVVLIFVFGFLPWSEVSCNSKEIEFRLSQSGYQALYGGVSAPPAVEIMLEEQAEKVHSSPIMSAQELRKKLGVERSYLANVSPFLVLFWGTNLALLGIVCCAPLGGWRLGFTLTLCALMLSMLLVHACLGLPLERRIGHAIAEAVREEGPQAMMLLAFKSGKTVWFWLTLASVVVLAATEPLLNGFRAERWSGWLIPGGITATAAILVFAGLAVQFALRESVVGTMENRIAQLQQAEDRKRRKAEAEQRAREEERLADIRRQEAEAERLRQLAILKEKEARLLEQRRLHEREQQQRRALLEQQRREEEARRQEEEARQKAQKEAEETAAREAARREELARKEKEEAEREAARKAELEKQGLPYYPRPRTLYAKHTAEEWYQLLRDNPRDARIHAQALAALPALREEGMPFLLDYLPRQTTPKDRDAVLRLIHVEYVHPNDLHKLLPCLDRYKNYVGTRLLALKYLEKRPKDLKKDLVPKIENLVEDMLTNSRFKEETKDEVRNRLKVIRAEAK